jgi:ribosomal protection tetracycline resistance protein
VETPGVEGDVAVVEAMLPSARLYDLQRQLSGLTRGEGVLESSFAGYRAVSGDPPSRRRTMPNPLNLSEYLMHLAHRV